MIEIPVVIVGGGPVGLALAADLGWRGVRCLLVEQNSEEIGPAKMMVASIRTMEICRRLGCADDVQNWGFPPDFSLDNVFVTNLNGYEIGRIKMPTMGRPYYPPSSPEAQMHCPQTWFDPILRDRARSFSGVEMHFRTRFESYVQDTDGVTIELRARDTDRLEHVRAKYLVGCDAYASRVRALMGVEMHGDHVLDHSINIEVRIPHLSSFHDKGDAGRYVFIGPEGTWATFVAINGVDTWRITLYGANEIDVKAIDVDASIRRILEKPFPYEIIHVGHWVRRAVVADRFGDGRVFVAGDAAHTLPPNGGFGMNTGIADAAELAWKVAAAVDGWGGARLLESYDIERRPVGVRAVQEARMNYMRLVNATRFPEIEEESDAGEKLRRFLGGRLTEENAKSWQPLGIHLGYSYDDSSLVVPDGTPRPLDDLVGYEPTARPGSRAPHAWLSDGRSTLDLFGRGFTLLSFGADETEIARLHTCAEALSVPLNVERIENSEIATLYGRRLVLVRPDGHVAWRADVVPSDARALLNRVRGADQSIAARNGADENLALDPVSRTL
jgi:2-polyprenyl-6-methoxyphenol hydroxylase-like FAD-dependent oxidoreductase